MRLMVRLVVLQFLTFLHFNPGNGSTLFATAEKFLQVKNVAHCAGHIQFLGIYDSWHE
jgi:hypothetical protein